ncbi:MAG: helix-turn-helix domain-containing protein [Deltaproteobacteria bacterium]|nr:MAG: helix-turn-helix domain-containing protein [Deltaproteobacteria bacterium]
MDFDRASLLFTAEEAAKYLRLHVKSIYRLARDGKIPGRKVGGSWRFHRDALDLWIKNERGTFQEH